MAQSCPVVKTVCAAACDSTTIQGAVDLLPATLSDYSCVIIQDAGAYNEEVTVANFINNGSSITIRSATGLEHQIVVDPPANSTAAFMITQSSVNIYGIDIIPSNSLRYGIYASSAYVTVSSANISDASGKIDLAGVFFSSWGAASDLVVQVESNIIYYQHYAFLLNGSNNVVMRSTATGSYSFGISGSSNLITSVWGDSYQASYIHGGSNNSISLGQFSNVYGSDQFEMDAFSSSNTISSSTLRGAVTLNGSSNTLRSVSISGGFFAGAVILNGPYNSLVNSYVSAFPGVGVPGVRVHGSHTNIYGSTLVTRGFIFNSNTGGVLISTDHVTIVGSSITIYNYFAGHGALETESGAGVNNLVVQGCSLNVNDSLSYGLFLNQATASTIVDSYIEGQAAAEVLSSANTVLGNNRIVPFGNYPGVLLQSSSNVQVSSCVVSAGPQATGIALSLNSGPLILSTNSIVGAQYGITALAQGALGRIYITSNTIVPAVTTSNDAYGLYLSGLVTGATVQNNAIVWRQSGSQAGHTAYGLYSTGGSGLQFAHNRISQPGMLTAGSFVGILLDATSQADLEFNDVYSVGVGLTNTYMFEAVNNSARNAVRNNIFSSSWSVSGSSASLLVDAGSQTGFSSDYNDWFSSNASLSFAWGSNLGLPLSGWQALSGQDAHSVSVNPLYASPSNEDFHPLSNSGHFDPSLGTFIADSAVSLTIDAGDPAEPYALEPSPNGLRVNQGSFGSTVQASKSARAPGSPVIAAVSLSSITVSFTPVASNGLVVDASTASNFSGTLFSSSTSSGLATSLAPQSLALNTTYYLRAGALQGSVTFYADTTPAFAVTLATTPAPLSFTAIGANQFTLNWQANANSAGTIYEAAISTSINFTGPPNLVITTVQNNIFSGLIAGATYYARVRAVNWEGVPSPYALGAVVLQSGVITISGNRLSSVWYSATDVVFNAQGATNYHYRVSASASDAAQLTDPVFDGSALALTVPQGISYFYVLGIDGVGASVGTARFGPIELDTGTPTIPAVAAQTSAIDPTPILSGGSTLATTPRFSWSLPTTTSPIVGYSYLISLDPLAVPAQVVNTTLNFADVALTLGSGSYYFTVRAENLAGNWGTAANFNFDFTTIPQVSAVTLKSSYFNPARGQCATLQIQNAQAGHLKVAIYTALGQKVAVLADTDAGPGSYSLPWCGRNSAGALVATGVYYLHIESPAERRDYKLGVVK